MQPLVYLTANGKNETPDDNYSFGLLSLSQENESERDF